MPTARNHGRLRGVKNCVPFIRSLFNRRGVLAAALGCIVLVAGLAILYTPPPPNPAAPTVQYAVYADYLSKIAAEPWTHSNPFVQHGIVLHQSPPSKDSPGLFIQSPGPFIKKDLNDMRSDTWKDYIVQNSAGSETIGLPDVYLSPADLKDPALARERIQQHSPFKDDSFNQYALQAEVSRIGLNRDSTQAVFHAWLVSGLCPSSEFVVMRRTKDGKWQIQNRSIAILACY